ncbi:MAG: penicillin-binding protein activator LpoB [Spirochaetaceae bacterium]|jgi:hypothetical protein|nr:penicillin-binding protein activator LpoB [Spirochaetaceae bacterium]
MVKVYRKAACFIMLCLTWSAVYAVDTLDEAIERESAYIIDRAPDNSILAVVNIQSGSTVLSDYIMERFPDFLVNNQKKVTFVDRSKLDLIQKEITFQYSGEVSDETMVSIGQKTGAQIIVADAVTEMVDGYNFSIKLLDVRTAALLGSSSTKIAHDDKMESYLPNSQAAQRAKRQSIEARERKDSAIRTVKTALGIFPKGFYLGYLGSLNAPIGVSLGNLNTGVSLFIDNELGPPDFEGYTRSGSMSYRDNTVYNGGAGYQYTGDEGKKTAFTWNCILGLNINIIKSFLWVDIGAGFEYRREYALFTENSSNGTNKIWIENGNDANRMKLALSAGLFLKLWYLYAQVKYQYIAGEEIDYTTYGLNQMSVGLGYVWKKD